MNAVFVALGIIVSAAAAVRSTWSPCGLSMLSTITPLGERSRRQRFKATASWFVAGAMLGGVCLGGVTALLAVGVAGLHWPETRRVALAALACTVVAGSDARLFGLTLPFHRRQVNERWLDQFRPWVYGGGFGWQIGAGLVTYIATGCVYLLVVLGALSAAPQWALGLGALFGTMRGLAVLIGARVRQPASLVALHRTMARLDPFTTSLAAAAAGAGATWLWAVVWWPAAVGTGVAGVVVGAWRLTLSPERVSTRAGGVESAQC